jgi:flagellar hook protein FlgE
MAESPSHKIGQIIGDLLELSLEPLLRDLAERYKVYLDKKGTRPARGRNKKLTWMDKYGNKHDLDFVMEKEGTDQKIGYPIAFIEVAWRRYTKHSRNKAQEIQGAIIPLRDTNYIHAPFIGVLLAGEFTEGALQQLHSLGFNILYFPYETVIEAFQKVGVDVSFDEDTPTEVLKEKVNEMEELSEEQYQAVAHYLYKINSDRVHHFTDKLEQSLNRQIEIIRIIPLRGNSYQVQTINDAIRFIEDYDEDSIDADTFQKYEITIKYNNDDKIEGQFKNKDSALRFLYYYLPPEYRPVIED